MDLDKAVKSIFRLKASIEQLFFREFDKRILYETDMNHTHIITLIFLLFNGKSSMTELSKRINLEKGSFTPVAARLIKKGYIKKVKSKEDGRVYIISLTKKGKDFAEHIKDEHIKYIKSIIEGLNDKEKEIYFKSVYKVTEITENLKEK